MHVAAIASGVWLLIGVLLGWAMLAPELQRAPTLLEMLSRPTAITLAATIVLPIALFWFIALLIWRAQELKLMSSAMTEVAIRLAEPDRMAEQQIASVGQAVRRQVNHMNEAVSRALGRAGELEALVHNEVTSLERSYTQNENRIRGLLDELAGERTALLSTSERVSGTLKELGNDIPTLVDKLSDQQVKLARFIEQAGQNLVSLEHSLATNANHLASSVGARTEELKGVLTDRTAELSGLLEHRSHEIAAALQAGRADLDQRLVQHTGELQSALGDFAGGLDQALSQRTEGLQTVLEEYTRALDQTMESRQQALDSQLVHRTQALDDAFSERLKLFDETILRSTIAIDSTVADKARALSTALDTHAQEIAQVLGRQAGQLDEQIMHGVNAVRRASENVTRQSVQAIEGLSGQAELLRNLSDNLLGQINTVTNRFDQQGQAMLRAANTLESTNRRLDTSLQHRQVELTETLEHLNAKAETFERTIRGYPAALEGTVNEIETRARSAGEFLARGVEERSRLALTEMERLRHVTDGEGERAVQDLRKKFESISQQVSQDIGSLNSRLSTSYDDMRDRASRTLAEIDTEQQRLKRELERLPEATRASADQMRVSLQEQLKALEQLSSLSSREMHRAELTAPTPQAANPSATQAPPRAISSVTQTLANELAGRQRPSAGNSLVPAPAAAEQGRDGWKLGELLARASQDDSGELNLAGCARALDPTTASAIWSRFRAGQRGVMVRSIYTLEGRSLFDDVQRRYASDAGVRESVNRYLQDFVRILRDADQRDPSGRTSQSHIVSDHGRAYLFLAHASGHLS